MHKILFSKAESGFVRAVGVQVAMGDGSVQNMSATKDVILAAGVFNTPKLLELSGVGDKALLDELGIPVTLDLPGVGQNLQDHLMTGVSYEVVEGVITGDCLLRQEPEALDFAQKLYVEHQAGPFTIGGMQSHAFMPTPGPAVELGLAASDSNDELKAIVRSIAEDPMQSSGAWLIFLAQANLHEGGKNFVGNELLPGNFASLGCIQSHPFSRGSSHIMSADVDAPPVIDPCYFSNPADLEIMARHVQALEGLRNTKELAPFFKPEGRRNHPDAFKIGELEEAKKYILDTATTTYHTCGTAAIRPRDKGGVVDSKLVVHGTENLRIVDASIFPLIPRGNIISTVYAVAEKASDIIKGT